MTCTDTSDVCDIVYSFPTCPIIRQSSPPLTHIYHSMVYISWMENPLASDLTKLQHGTPCLDQHHPWTAVQGRDVSWWDQQGMRTQTMALMPDINVPNIGLTLGVFVVSFPSDLRIGCNKYILIWITLLISMKFISQLATWHWMKAGVLKHRAEFGWQTAVTSVTSIRTERVLWHRGRRF